jgi:hypothetical protein
MKNVIILLILLFSLSLFAENCNDTYVKDYNKCVYRTNQRLERCQYYRTTRRFYLCRFEEVEEFIECINDAHNDYVECRDRRVK